MTKKEAESLEVLDTFARIMQEELTDACERDPQAPGRGYIVILRTLRHLIRHATLDGNNLEWRSLLLGSVLDIVGNAEAYAYLCATTTPARLLPEWCLLMQHP
jgi:hypothetical protein